MTKLEEKLYIVPSSFEELEGIVAGFSTRHGGVSKEPFSSLNLGLSTTDVKEDVLTNRHLLFSTAGVSVDSLAITGQVHGTAICEVNSPGLYEGFDGLITNKPGVILCLSAADCASVLLVDINRGIVGACHAGWRGTAGRIVEKTVGKMVRRGARPYRMKAYISPCISANHFEVGPEVAEQFDSAYIHRFEDKQKVHIDLKAAIKGQLTSAEIADNDVEVSPHCTCRETEHFYSYRAERGRTGRMMGFVGLV